MSRADRYAVLRIVAVLFALAASCQFARADVITNLGFSWTVTTPDQYQISLDGVKPGETRPLPGPNQTPAIPLALIVPNWQSLAPIEFHFKAGQKDPGIDRFSLRMTVANDTGVAWQGFNISIRDDNGIPYYNQTTQEGGTLRHPDSAHIHTNKINPDKLGFDAYQLDQFSYTGGLFGQKPTLRTAHPDINGDQGVEVIHLFSNKGFVVQDQATWKPFFVDPNNLDKVGPTSVLDFHLHADSQVRGNDLAAFTVIMQPIPAPEPASAVLVGVGMVGILVYRWRRRPS